MLYRQMGQTVLATDAARRGSELSSRCSERVRAQVLLNQAYVLERRGQFGEALDARFAREARAAMKREPRYRWLGGMPHARALRWLASSHAMVISSRMEGGANVVSEALRIGVGMIPRGEVGMVVAQIGLHHRHVGRPGIDLGLQVAQDVERLGPKDARILRDPGQREHERNGDESNNRGDRHQPV